MNIGTFKQKVKVSVDNFWSKVFEHADLKPWNYKELQLPLARIKRLMKVEEEVKMIASEVPVLFSKITEIFIQELTLRAWINTEENKRRILQKNDLAAAVKTSDVYDFLIFIIPRNELEATFGDFNKFNDFENKYSNYFPDKKENIHENNFIRNNSKIDEINIENSHEKSVYNENSNENIGYENLNIFDKQLNNGLNYNKKNINGYSIDFNEEKPNNFLHNYHAHNSEM